MVPCALIAAAFPVVRAASHGATVPADAWTELHKRMFGDPLTMTPRERLRQTWLSVARRQGWEYEMILMTGAGGFIFGGIIGMMAKNEEHRVTVVRQNSEVQFDHRYLAQRKMRDQTYLRNLKNGTKFGWRTGLFSALLAFGSLSSLSYRNDINPLDFVAVFALTGGVWKWQQGPKGMLASATTTALFGLVTGCLAWAAVKVSGVSVNDFRVEMGGLVTKWNVNLSRARMEQMKEVEGVLHEREMLLQQRRFEQRMQQQEADLLATQQRLAQQQQQQASQAPKQEALKKSSTTPSVA